ncbi:MucB/RseB C-terminal domain-containing protein [Shewanella sp. C32]|uniref:MucB/RseB C-terminal domain-containing protein n=1 Tax=Shewanella electrica TaxID=515560 RepID=A0ABT2FG18_9GAMM|nr:MucB/RseB C-terminal domain-containing protein [Shewanella electrica]MCH1925414.1 MucB/RseB C-terminal domain-containing protein [Shewanella electrica]MCS4555239.1 MucB/RseB C-terminal domain-containing protein [Shewanella electrica]
MRAVILSFIFLVVPAFAQEQLTAKAWLENMSQALHQKQFKLSVIQLQADEIRPIIYMHGVVDNTEVAFLEHLNGPKKNAIRVGNTVTYLEHEQQAYSIRANRIPGVLPEALAGDINELEAGYQFVVGGRTRLAGRVGQMIRFMPRDDYRYQAAVWIDMETYLPLRYDVITQDNKLLEQVLAIELFDFDEPPSLIKEAYKQPWPEAMSPSERQDGQNWQFDWLPAGFKVIVRDYHRLFNSSQAVEYVALTDGLSNISVYIARKGDTSLPDELITRNGIAMVTRDAGKQVEVVAIGKVPKSALERIAESIKLK